MQVSLVPPELFPTVLPLAGEYLERAAASTYGRYERNDIVELIERGDGHLWVVVDGTVIKGVAITRFWVYPRKKCLDILFMGGDGWFDWKGDLLGMLRRWAKDGGCEAVEASARPGFIKSAKEEGYRPLWQVYEMPVDIGDEHG